LLLLLLLLLLLVVVQGAAATSAVAAAAAASVTESLKLRAKAISSNICSKPRGQARQQVTSSLTQPHKTELHVLGLKGEARAKLIAGPSSKVAPLHPPSPTPHCQHMSSLQM
jgi:hypothetical protein